MPKIPQKLVLSILEAVQDQYAVEIIDSAPLYSYNGGVFELTTDSKSRFVLKTIRDPDIYNLNHIKAEIDFCSYVIEHVSEFTIPQFIPNSTGKILQNVADTYFYLIEKHEIVKKEPLPAVDQIYVGELMRVFHTELKDFKHEGIGDTSWMREVDESEYDLLRAHSREEEFAEYMEPLNYDNHGISRTLIHGDWHSHNFSFTSPPFLFDLDTLCYGSACEEIARSITHWYAGVPLKDFHDNLLKGYSSLPENEIAQIPRIAIAICYKQFVEVYKGGDHTYAKHFLELADEIKREFDL